MRPYQPAVAALALAAVLPLAAAAEAATPAAGAATSSATLASLAAVGKTVDLATVVAQTSSTSGALAKVTVSPLKVDGADVVEAVSVEPSSSPVTVPSVGTPAALAPIVAASSPSVVLTASSNAAGQASGLSTPAGLGSIAVLGLPLTIDGAVSLGSLVTPTKADSAKTVSITGIALPSLADILSALGVDVSKLPVETLNELLNGLPITITSALQTAADSANAAIDDAQTDIADATSFLAETAGDLDDAEAALNAAQGSLTTAQAAYQAALTTAGVDESTYEALDDAVQATLYPDVFAAEGQLATAEGAIGPLQAAVGAAQDAVDDAQDALNGLVDTLTGLVAGLGDIVEAVFADTPLVSLAGAEVGTLARVDSAKTAKVVGTVSGLKVLDLDVLDAVTGSSTLDLVTAAEQVVAQVNSTVAGVMSTLSSILSDVAGVSFAAPQVRLLEKSTATGTDGAFGTADASVSILSVTIPTLTLPEALLLDDVVNALPVNLSIVDELASATGFSLKVGTLTEAARYRPAALTGAPTGGGLPATGAPVGIALLAALALAGGAALRRSTRADALA